MLFYISDIHIEHKIRFEELPEVMPEEEFGKIVAAIVDEVFASTMPHNEEDYLFIMGDTCESTHIGKLFYSRLVQLWKPKTHYRNAGQSRTLDSRPAVDRRRRESQAKHERHHCSLA